MGLSRRPSKYGRKGAKGGASGRKGFILTMVDGLNAGKEFSFELGATIGRVEQNDIVLVEPGISRNHARVIDDHGVWLVEDQGSANGTRLNGEQIAESEVLRDGDYITLSQTTLQFSNLNAARGEITAQTMLTEEEAAALDRPVADDKPPAAQRFKALLGTRAGKLVLVGLVLALVGGGLYYALRDTTAAIIFDQSSSPLTYSEEDSFFNAVLGNGKYDQTHKEKVMVDFEYLGGRVTLQYGAWGVDKVGELEVLLNGKQVGLVPLTMHQWVYGLKLTLPRKQMKKGTNRVTFNNKRNPPNADRWEVCYVQLAQEAIPPPNPLEARQQFELAKKAWEDREIEPSNMYTSLVRFNKARNLLEGLSTKPDLFQEVLDYIEKVDKELTTKFENGLFSARRAEKLDRDRGKARGLLLKTRRYFRKEDFRYREIQRYLDALADS